MIESFEPQGHLEIVLSERSPTCSGGLKRVERYETEMIVAYPASGRRRPRQRARRAGAIEGASVMFLSDEHASLMIPADSPLAVGDQVQLYPSHIDPTINLHDVFYALEGDTVVGVWPIIARGYSHQREG